jgi:Spondin_N
MPGTRAWSRWRTPDFVIFAEGEPASEALAKLARVGDLGALKKSVKQGQRDGLVSQYFVSSRKRGPTERVSFALQLDGGTNSTWVSVVAKILPSPDWFFGVKQFPLCDDSGSGPASYLRSNSENSINSITGYDSGFVSGTDYTDSGKELTPGKRVNVSIIRTVSLFEPYGELTNLIDGPTTDLEANDGEGPGGGEDRSKGSSSGLSVWKRVLLALVVVAAIGAVILCCVLPRLRKGRVGGSPRMEGAGDRAIVDEEPWS